MDETYDIMRSQLPQLRQWHDEKNITERIEQCMKVSVEISGYCDAEGYEVIPNSDHSNVKSVQMIERWVKNN